MSDTFAQMKTLCPSGRVHFGGVLSSKNCRVMRIYYHPRIFGERVVGLVQLLMRVARFMHTRSLVSSAVLLL